MAGFEVYDELGKLQVGSEFFSHYLASQGTGLSTTKTFGNTTPSQIQITVPAGVTRPIIAIVCGNNRLAGIWVVNGNVHTYACSGPVNTPYTYYVFSSTLGQVAVGGPLELFNAAGELTYSSNRKPMRIMALSGEWGAAGFPEYTNPYDPTVYGYSGSSTLGPYTGKTLAFAQTHFGGHGIVNSYQLYINGVLSIDPNPGFPNENETREWRAQNNGKIYGASIANNTLTAGEISFDDVEFLAGNGQEPDPQKNWANSTQFLAIDVTNY